jgi:hypothetical protein
MSFSTDWATDETHSLTSSSAPLPIGSNLPLHHPLCSIKTTNSDLKMREVGYASNILVSSKKR